MNIKKTPAPRDVELPITPTPDTLVYTLVPTPASINEWFKQFIKAYLEV